MSVKKRFARLKNKLQDWLNNEDACLNLCKMLLFYMGLWPQRKERPGFVSLCRRWLAHGVFAMINYANLVGHPVITYQSIGLENIDPLLESVANTFAAVLLYLHIYCLLFQRDRLHKVFKAFRAMRREGTRLRCRPVAILLRNKKMSDFLLTSMLFVFALTAAVGTTILCKLLFGRTFAFHEWYPVDKFKSPAYEIIFAINFFRLAYLISMAILLYYILCCLLVETIGQYRLLSYNLGNVLLTSKKGDDNTSTSIATRYATIAWKVDEFGMLVKEEVRRKRGEKTVLVKPDLDTVRQCVLHHHAILGFVHEFQSAFNLILFSHVICTMVPTAIGITLIICSEAIQDKMAMAIAIIFGCYAFLGGACVFADEITAQDEAIREAVYGCDWIRASDVFKRSMRIIMCRCNQPVVIKVAGFIPLNMETFYATVKMTYTYTMAVVTHYQ